ncbi:MAG TPA: helix-hairpin-helix domain-containing protein [Gammaproteobacteria bacterium]|nr:helix-hairpin-helix domain-containing protein [Gammaproteobacteria bacterium]
MPVRLHVLVRWLGFDIPVPAAGEQPAQVYERTEQQTQPLSIADRQAAQEFLAGVRAAGVNVTIARALYAAGIRSARHLQLARDEQLRRIHGVGPATVRRLRVHFG